jgi:hypothetical protein
MFRLYCIQADKVRLSFRELGFTRDGQSVQEENEFELLTNSGSEGFRSYNGFIARLKGFG